MTICPLPDPTIASIGSLQALTDSASLVKELVDNALDARASSISVEIAPNTLDVIQVTDNGHGIAPDDRKLVCRRHCTSKLRDFAEVATVGGKCLGFRGEALASAADLSGGLIVSTKADDEVVGVSLKVSRHGEITSQEHVTRPTGTTVRVTDFLKNIPVRRQTALKTVGKCAGKIKSLLQAYALARPSVRFSLRTLGVPGDKSNWTYALASNPNVADAALQVVGKNVVKQCCRKAWSSRKGLLSLDLDLSREDDEYIILALVPVKNCDVSIINNAGQFLSIDSRPVACLRRTTKKIVGLFKSGLQSCNDQDSTISSPFFCINVLCPPGSYDPNIEPAKDNVLFIDEARILEIFNSFLQAIYGDDEVTSSASSVQLEIPPQFSENLTDSLVSVTKKTHFPATLPQPGSLLENIQQNGLDLRECVPGGLRSSTPRVANDEDQGMLFRLATPDLHYSPDASVHQSPAKPSLSDTQVSVPETDFRAEPSSYASSFENDNVQPRRNVPLPSMYNGIDQVEPGSFDDESVFEAMDGIEDDTRDPKVSNPWIIAKMNAAMRPRKPTNPAPKPTNQLMTPEKHHGEPSSPLVHPSPRAWTGKPSAGNVNKPFKPQQPLIQPRGVDVRKRQTGSLDQWMHRSSKPSTGHVPVRAPRMSHIAVDPAQELDPDDVQLNQGRMGSLARYAADSPLSSQTNDGNRRQTRGAGGQRGARPPVGFVINPDIDNKENQASSGEDLIPEAEHYIQARSGKAGLRDTDGRGNSEFGQQGQPEGNIQRLGQLRLLKPLGHNDSREDRVSTLNPQTVTPPSSPREYFFGLRRAETSDGRIGRKLKRRKTAKLPLERVPVHHMVQNLRLEVLISESTIVEAVTRYRLDSYIRTGQSYVGFVGPPAGEVKMWESRLQAMLPNGIVAA